MVRGGRRGESQRNFDISDARQNRGCGQQEIQKIAAFEGAFERVFAIIAEEGSADGGIVVQVRRKNPKKGDQPSTLNIKSKPLKLNPKL